MNRPKLLQQLGDSSILWDVVVIGGGATGLGAAVDAASRKYRTLLLEQHDFAKGTSSRSTKLIHGGVRYLKQGEFRLIREALRERAVLLRLAPHLVHTAPFIVPTYRWGEGVFYGAGLKLYESLAGRLGLGPCRLLSRADALAQIPNLEPTGLRGGVLYFDGQFDDARLAINLAQTLDDLGGVPLNYLRVTGLHKSSGRVDGVQAVDTETGREYRVRARAVINAAGVFGQEIVRMDDAAAPEFLALSQGIHLVVDQQFLRGSTALMVPRTEDGRVLFLIPWLDKVLVGTTDTPVSEPSLEPRPRGDEIEFLLRHAQDYLASAPSRSDVRSVFAGLRPLVKAASGKRTAALSRDYLVTVSTAGLITVSGGKWTTYRRMGVAAVDRAVDIAGLEKRPSRTAELPIHGALARVDRSNAFGVYGSDASYLRQLIADEPSLGESLHDRLPIFKAEVIWAARQEMARTVEDVLARRTRCLFLDARASIEAAAAVAELLGRELGHDAAWRQTQTRSYSELASGYCLP